MYGFVATSTFPHLDLSSPRPFLTSTLPHLDPSSPRPFLTSTFPHLDLSSPRPFLTSTLPHLNLSKRTSLNRKESMSLTHCGFTECDPFSRKNEIRHWITHHGCRPPRALKPRKGSRWKCPKCNNECSRSRRCRHRCSIKGLKRTFQVVDSSQEAQPRTSNLEPRGVPLTERSMVPNAANVTQLFVWTSAMDYTGINRPSYFEEFTIQKPNLGGHTISSQCPFFARNNFSPLQERLGHGFVFRLADDVHRMHQGVVMVQIMKFAHLRNVECHPLRSLTSERPPSFNLSFSNKAWDVVFVLDYDNNLECAAKLSNLDLLVREWSNAGRRCRIFPSFTEIEWDNFRIHDILALDEVAEQAAKAGKHEYSYRPRTCHSYKKGLCTLQNCHTVLKASHSSQSKYVIDLGSNRHQNLQCCLTDDFQESQPEFIEPRLYFHQEMISGFDKIGEFRALIATKPNPRCLRNREPIIESIIHLRYKGASACTPCFALTGSEAFWLEISPLDIFKLRESALFVYEALRKRPDWKKHFETLEVGARLDISVCLGAPPRFFVGEITRFQQGSWHSNSAAPPYLGFASAFARALNDYFPPPTAGTNY